MYLCWALLVSKTVRFSPRKHGRLRKIALELGELSEVKKMAVVPEASPNLESASVASTSISAQHHVSTEAVRSTRANPTNDHSPSLLTTATPASTTAGIVLTKKARRRKHHNERTTRAWRVSVGIPCAVSKHLVRLV